jgi:hypothetical protein
MKEYFKSLLKKYDFLDHGLISEDRIHNGKYLLNDTVLGYWKDGDKEYYGNPEKYVTDNQDWILNDKNKVADILEKFFEDNMIIHMKGFSYCRFCKEMNGTREAGFITSKEENKIFQVPEGYIHYIREHNVMPHKKIIEIFINLSK